MTDASIQIKHLEERIAYLEEINRFTHDAVEMASSLGDFQDSINKLDEPLEILLETRKRLIKLIHFKATAFFLIRDTDSDFFLFDCKPSNYKDFFQRETDFLIEEGTFARAIDENRPVIVYNNDFSSQLLLHVITTVIKVRGMFVGLLQENAGDVQEISLGLLSVVLNKSANALECFDLYETIRSINQELADKVERLAESESELKRHRHHLEDLVAERTSELKTANEQLKAEIAERKRAWETSRKYEEKLRQSQRLQAIGTLAGGIAHDFNNILGSIMGYADMAIEAAGRDTRISRYLNQVMTAGRRAKDLVQQILAFSRQDEQEKIPVSVNSIVKEVLQLLQANLPDNISIVHPGENEPVTIMANPTQLHRIIMNLCANALHAMKDNGGELEIKVKESASPVPFIHSGDPDTPRDYIEIQVRDTGRGIDQSVMERIFDPFFTTKQQGEGSGMGLAVVHGTVKSLGGEITVESRKDQGATFHVYLPKPDERAAVEIEKNYEIKGGDERILLVDDEPDLVQLGVEMLESLGYSVVPAENSLTALELFEKDPKSFHAVITDLVMPDLNGIQLAKALKKIRPDMPVILCSGFGMRIEHEKAGKNGIDVILKKPLLKRDIDRAVRNILDRTNGKER